MPEEYNGPYKSVAIFGDTDLLYAVCRWDQADLAILYAGLCSLKHLKALLYVVLSLL